MAECEVVYHGRAASVADAGDYVVMLKPDGSLQVHGYRGVKPVNWQPQTDDVWIGLDEGQPVLVAERRSPEELVRIVFLETALAQALELREGSGFVLMGSEAEMQRALARQPELIEPGLTVLDHELPTDVGGIDLFARDADGAAGGGRAEARQGDAGGGPSARALRRARPRADRRAGAWGAGRADDQQAGARGAGARRPGLPRGDRAARASTPARPSRASSTGVGHGRARAAPVEPTRPGVV
jgi:hypothetical protein